MRIFRGAGDLVPPSGRRLAPILTGMLLVLSFPPFDLPVLPFVALVPLLLTIAEQPTGREGRWIAARAGALAGLVYFGLLLYWLLFALIHYSALAVPAYILTTLVLTGFTGVFAAALHYALERTPVPLALAAAILWTAMEWLQGHLGDLSFPWLGLGSALSATPQAAGAADLVGASGLTFWLALVNGLVATVSLRLRGEDAVLRPAVVTVLVALLPLGYGLWRAETLDRRPAARVAVVQPNIPEDVKMDRAEAVDSSMTALTNLTRRIEPGSVDLVVWPEVAVPALITGRWQSALRERVRSLSEWVGAPIAVGAYGAGGDPDDPTLYNSAYIATPAGLRGDPYHKQHLVPFVERVPFLDPAWLEPVIGDMQYFGGLGRGRTAEPIAAADARFGVLICYESIFASLARRFRTGGADFLVNMTNDAWYGREPWYARTTALWQHPAHLTMRAIEQRVGIARAANTGISMFVDPLGYRYERTELFEPDVRSATVYTTDTVTLYARWGDWLATGAALAAVLLLAVARWAPSTGGAARPRAVQGVPDPR